MIIANGWKPLTITTRHSILDVAATLDLPLDLTNFAQIRAVQEQIRDCLEEGSFISKYQFDYHPNRSTQQATILLPSRIIGKKVKSIECIIKKRAINLVDKVLMNDNVCGNFSDNFAINSHAKYTRNKNKLLKLSRVKLEFAKRSFKYMRAILCNDLPLNIRACENDQNFRKFFNDYVF